MDFLNKYRKIVDGLVKKSFPELKRKKIIIEEKNTLKYRAHTEYSFSGFKIFISTQLRDFSEQKVKRILIHELCHLEIFLHQGFIWTNIEWFI